MATLNEIWKAWMKSSVVHNDDVDFRSIWCFLSGYFGSKEMGKEGEEYLRKMLGMRVKKQ